MVKRLLQLPVVPRQDAADALGLAITHAHASPSMNKLAAQGVLNRKTHGMFRSGRSH
jgi:crossover junction endodeoxyribonuclease RuvC